jgi:quinol monooxygenase YgiN
MSAKAGKSDEVVEFLESGRSLVTQEPGTLAWFAARLGPSEFAIFDVFADEAGRQAHLQGAVARALMERAPDLLSQPPEIMEIDVVADKMPG